MNLGKTGFGVLAIIVAGGLLWLFNLGGLEYMKRYFKRPTVEVTSLGRPYGKEFFSNDRLRFKLQNVKCERVFWLFDESDFSPGSMIADFAFDFDEKLPPSTPVPHRTKKKGTGK